MFLAMNLPVFSQTKILSYKEKAIAVNENINRYFSDTTNQLYYETNELPRKPNEHSFLWPLCAFMQGANEMEILTGKRYLKSALVAIEKYDNPSQPAPGYQAKVMLEGQDTRYYDDNQWIGIAAMDAYERTKNKAYLVLGQKTYRFMMTGFDQATGGGIYWREGDHATKNTCSNGPGILLALQLYQATKEKGYLDTALLLYRWTNEKLQAPNGLFYDAIKLPSLKLDKRIYAYNSGTMLQANVILAQITKQENYLTEAKRIAAAAEKHFFKDGKFVDSYWFSAVLMRGFVALYSNDKAKLQIFATAADHIWTQEKDKQGLLGKREKKSLIDQAAMLEIYARLSVSVM
jgi:uncharacterized protein YyaL (SSP411 family)